MKKVFVLWYQEYDSSGCGVIRAYTSQEGAVKDCDMLTEYANKEFFVDEIELIEEGD